jgi:hypothetical protein
VAVVAVWGCTRSTDQKANAAISIVATPQTFDAGAVEEGQEIVAAFELRNVSSCDAHLGDLKSSCGCLVASVSSRTLRPGDVTTVTCTVRTDGLSRNDVEKTVTVFVDDAAPLRLAVRARVEKWVEIKPRRVILGEMVVGEARRDATQLKSLDDVAFRITDLSAAGCPLKVAFSDVMSTTHTLAVTVPAEAPTGDFAGRILITTDHPHQGHVVIPISGRIQDVRVEPPGIVNFGRVSAGVPVTKKLTLREGTKSERVRASDVKVTCNTAANPLDVSVVQENGLSVLELTLSAERMGKSFVRGVVTIALGRRGIDDISLAFQGFK